MGPFGPGGGDPQASEGSTPSTPSKWVVIHLGDLLITIGRLRGLALWEPVFCPGLEPIELAGFNQPGLLFVGQSLNPLEFYDRGYLIEQVDREYEGLFSVPILVKLDSGDRSHLLGNPG